MDPRDLAYYAVMEAAKEGPDRVYSLAQKKLRKKVKELYKEARELIPWAMTEAGRTAGHFD